ncbi:BUD22-domain-containing protein [Umbelopsis sp. PMI_123]|nr:BUD22-domain-containing protein [Umbelopsis sp. PMI_123]
MAANSATKAATRSQTKQKENLNWKINYLAAQLGGKSRISRANAAAKSLVKDGEASKIDEEVIKKQLLELKAQKINMKLFHINKEIKKLMKKAKTSEIQRLIKKSKAAKTALESEEKTEGKEEAKETAIKVDDELTMLKSMDLDLIATTATRNKISKHKSIKNSDLLSMLEFPFDEPAKSHNEESAEKAKLQHNVEARLLNYNLIKEEFSKLLEEIDKIVEAGSHVPEVVDETNDVEINKMEVEQEADQEVETEDPIPKPRSKPDSLDKVKPSAKKSKSSKKEVEQSSTFVTTLHSDSDEEKESPKKKNKSKDDNWVDENFDKYYGKVKKNRPSQRRRREMYEKLYGDEANHVKAQLEAQKAKEERKLARQMKKSASGGNSATLGKRRRNASDPSESVKPKPDNEQLHPSWEAKKLQQDLMAKALSGAGGLGNKKIVFDDSD